MAKRKVPGGHRNPKSKSHATTTRLRKLEKRVSNLEKLLQEKA